MRMPSRAERHRALLRKHLDLALILNEPLPDDVEAPAAVAFFISVPPWPNKTVLFFVTRYPPEH